LQLLGGDVGGTGTRLALFEIEDRALRTVAEASYDSADYPTLAALLERFFESCDARGAAACFGLPGPIVNRRCEVTNLPWRVDADELQEQFALGQVWLLNDLEASAWAIEAYREDDLVELRPGRIDPTGNAALLSAGTGHGQAGLFFDGTRLRPFATEGGHTSFAPRNERQDQLLRYLRERHEHVALERVVSGPGLRNIYEFLRAHRGAPEPLWLAEAMQNGDPSAVISQVGLERRDPVCDEALDVFVEAYGFEAGNLALKFKATGGIFLGGGIAPKILDRLREPLFEEAFLDKGPMRDLVAAIPVRVVVASRAGVLGAARYAAVQAGLL